MYEQANKAKATDSLNMANPHCNANGSLFPFQWRFSILREPVAFAFARYMRVFYTELYSTESRHARFIRSSDEEDTEVASISSEEVKMALQAMIRVKAAGEVGMTFDLIKHGGDIMVEKLAALYMQCLMTSSLPEDLKNANFTLIHKKGYVKGSKNYRPISLLSVLYKIFTKIISNSIRATLDFKQPREQAGFRKGYSTMDHIHVINQVIEKSAWGEN